jgi:hypothetical protein
MKSPIPDSFWHGFAQHWSSVFIGFAMLLVARHCFAAGLRQSSRGLRSQRCYPSPSLRSGPSQAGPSLVAGCRCADCVNWIKNCFEIRDIALESASITTNQRGSTKCRSRLSSSLFSPRHLPGACRTQRRAVWLAPLRVRWSPMHWMKTCWPVPRLADLQVLPPAGSSLACRHVTPATDPAAFGRTRPIPRTIQANRLGGPFFFVPEGNADV